jgi:hypothetical protein
MSFPYPSATGPGAFTQNAVFTRREMEKRQVSGYSEGWDGLTVKPSA